MKDILARKLEEANLAFDTIVTAGTPRRLTVTVHGLADRQPDRSEEVVGPPRRAAFDDQGNPTPAALGFARSKGISLEDTRIIQTDRGE